MTTRRDFLRTSAVLGGAALMSTSVYAAGSDTIKVGLVGAGGRGSGAAGNCLDADKSVRIVAIGDAFKDRAENAARRLKEEYKDRVDVNGRVFIGLDSYKEVIPQCDLIILATPPGFRPQMIAAAVEAGKNIFTEKPVGVDGAGIRQVLAAYEQAQKKNLRIAAGTQRRHETSYNESMKRLHAGDIGDIVAGRCYWNMGTLWHRKKEQLSDLEWQIRNWLYFTWLSGDHITEQHVHNLDVINWALQAHPLSAIGLGGRQVRTQPEYGHIFDHHAVDYTYPKDVHVLSMCRQIAGCANDVSEALVGTRGSWTSHGHVIKGDKAWAFGRGKNNQPYVQEHVDLIQAIREQKALNELKNVAESTLTAIMGRLATYTGGQVTWEQALATGSLMPEKLSWDMTLPVPPVAMPGKTKLS